jgi:hypothetical protein
LDLFQFNAQSSSGSGSQLSKNAGSASVIYQSGSTTLHFGLGKIYTISDTVFREQVPDLDPKPGFPEPDPILYHHCGRQKTTDSRSDHTVITLDDDDDDDDDDKPADSDEDEDIQVGLCIIVASVAEPETHYNYRIP